MEVLMLVLLLVVVVEVVVIMMMIGVPIYSMFVRRLNIDRKVHRVMLRSGQFLFSGRLSLVLIMSQVRQEVGCRRQLRGSVGCSCS